MFEKEIKILVAGDSGTGKTSFIKKWIGVDEEKEKEKKSYNTTLKTDQYSKEYEFEQKKYKIILYDLLGIDKGENLTKAYAKDSRGLIVICESGAKNYDG